ncbi:hypothetical protein I6M49_22365 [Shewanella algae]|uniref:hypothetical protein n=1 Tax=Shewanella algae TaxID=38313 RepID=UPI001AACD1EB|nr:hypothetical protein [Shewanella algae]MBO2656191.1 hypothetical protein [Shewanella algae]
MKRSAHTMTNHQYRHVQAVQQATTARQVAGRRKRELQIYRIDRQHIKELSRALALDEPGLLTNMQTLIKRLACRHDFNLHAMVRKIDRVRTMAKGHGQTHWRYRLRFELALFWSLLWL